MYRHKRATPLCRFRQRFPHARTRTLAHTHYTRTRINVYVRVSKCTHARVTRVGPDVSILCETRVRIRVQRNLNFKWGLTRENLRNRVLRPRKYRGL